MERHGRKAFERVVGESASDVVFFGDCIGDGTDFSGDWLVDKGMIGDIIENRWDRCVGRFGRRSGRGRVSNSEFRRREYR
jgi:hypothetical protein